MFCFGILCKGKHYFVGKLDNRRNGEDRLFFSKSKIMEKEKGINTAVEF